MGTIGQLSRIYQSDIDDIESQIEDIDYQIEDLTGAITELDQLIAEMIANGEHCAATFHSEAYASLVAQLDDLDDDRTDLVCDIRAMERDL